MANYRTQVQRLIDELRKKAQEYHRGNDRRNAVHCHQAIQQLIIWQQSGYKGSPPDLSGFELAHTLELETSEAGTEVASVALESELVEPVLESAMDSTAETLIANPPVEEPTLVMVPAETLPEIAPAEMPVPILEAQPEPPAPEPEPQPEPAAQEPETNPSQVETIPVRSEKPFEPATPPETVPAPTTAPEIAQPAFNMAEPIQPAARIDRSLLEYYVKEAFDAYDDGDFELCLARLQLVLENDPDYPDIREKVTDANRKLREKRARLEMDRLKVDLQTAVDMSDLDRVTNQARAVIDEGRGDDELRNLYTDAIRRRNEKRRIQRTRTTAESVAELVTVNEAINDVIQAVRNGEKYWADDRYGGEPRPIQDVIDELRSLQPPLSKKACGQLQQRAATFMPANPRSAVVLLQDAISLECLDESVRQEAEKQLREAELAESRWKQADTLVTEALTSTTDPFVQFQRIQEADDIYPAHLGIAPAQDAVIRVVAALLTGEIRRAITESESRLADEDFAGARQVIFLVQSRAEKISPHPQDLQDAIQESRAMLERVAVSEKRRRQISEQAGVIREQLSRGDVALARQVFLDLPEDWQLDRMMIPLRAELDKYIGKSDILRQAQAMLNQGYWQECIAQCEKIGEEGEFGQQVKEIWARAEIGQYRDSIYKAHEYEYYDKVGGLIDTLLSLPRLTAAQKADLAREFRNLQREVQRRRLNNNLLGNSERLVEQHIKDGRLLRAHDLQQEMLKFPSTRVGELRDQLTRIRTEIHTRYIADLQAAFKEQNYAQAFQLAGALQQRELILDEVDRGLRRQVVLAYFRQQAEHLRLNNDWDLIVENWQQAIREFPTENQIRTEYHASLRQRLIFRCDTALYNSVEDKSSFNEVFSLLSETSFEAQEDPDLRIRRDTAQVMREAMVLYNAHAYESMVEFLHQQFSEKKRPELDRFCKQRVSEVMPLLAEEGDRLINNGNMLDGIMCYIAMFKLAPNNLLAQNRIELNLQNLDFVIDSALKKANDFSLGLDNVRQQLNDGFLIKQTLLKLENITGLLVIGRGIYDQRIKDSLKELENKLSILESCRQAIDRTAEKSTGWRSVLRTGVWIQVGQDIVRLQNDLTSNHAQVVELQRRTRRMFDLRRRLKESLKNLEGPFQRDEFSKAIEAADEALMISAEVQTPEDPDPFNLLKQYAHIFDAFTLHWVDGLEAILELLRRRRENYELWAEWEVRVDNKLKVIESNLDTIDQTFNPDHPHHAAVDTLERCINNCDEAIDLLTNQRPVEPPLSVRVRRMNEQADERLRLVEQNRAALHEKQAQYRENPNYVDLPMLISKVEELINQGNFSLATKLIEQGLDYDPSNSYLMNLKENYKNRRKK